MADEVQCFDNMVEREALRTLDETAEQIGIDPEVLDGFLLNSGYLYTDETGFLSINDVTNDGFFVRTRKFGAKVRSCCRHFSVTPKGFATFWILLHDAQYPIA